MRRHQKRLPIRDTQEKSRISGANLLMTGDEDTGVRKHAAETAFTYFPGVEDKSGVFFDLVRLTESQDAQLRKRAAELLAVAFEYSENKQLAWEELVRLASVEDREVRKGAVLALSSGYTEVQDKEKAWKDLLSAFGSQRQFCAEGCNEALGPAFFHVPDKTQAWRDLQALTDNPYIYVRRYAFRSLGRASLWRALRAENEAAYIFGLKEAVKYFKEAAETSVGTNIPEFYHPFYEALLFILFSDMPDRAKLESERYLSKVTGEIRELRRKPATSRNPQTVCRTSQKRRKSNLQVIFLLRRSCLKPVFQLLTGFQTSLRAEKKKLFLLQKP